MSSYETPSTFEQRKRDHLRLALDPKNQTDEHNLLARVALVHEALPDLNFSEISIQSDLFGTPTATPFLVSSMTAGHDQSLVLNQLLAEVCQERGWVMGVGSQRRELSDPKASDEWRVLRRAVSKVLLLGNIGIAQLITTPIETIQSLVDHLEASGMIVHTNPLQECLQPEGTPQFKGGLLALERLCQSLSVPVLLKETGCGFSLETLRRLKNLGLAAVDMSGFGGTHWGRIEGGRAPNEILSGAAESFKNWGIDSVSALQYAKEAELRCELWASGGVRSGLDAAKFLAMGAKRVGFAKPILEAALQGAENLQILMQRYEYELKMSLFLTGSEHIAALQETKKWHQLPR